MGHSMSFKAAPVVLLLVVFLVGSCFSCAVKPIVTGNGFCATQACTHIYNFRPCSYWNPAQCTCSGSTATCPSGYTIDSDGTKCYILRSGQTSWADASAICRSNGDDRLAVITELSCGRTGAARAAIPTGSVVSQPHRITRI